MTIAAYSQYFDPLFFYVIITNVKYQYQYYLYIYAHTFSITFFYKLHAFLFMPISFISCSVFLHIYFYDNFLSLQLYYKYEKIQYQAQWRFASQIQISPYLRNPTFLTGSAYFSYYFEKFWEKLEKIIGSKCSQIQVNIFSLILSSIIKFQHCFFLPDQNQMSGNFEAIIKIMQNQIQGKNSFCWKPASMLIEFAFEEGGQRPYEREKQDEENMENGELRKQQKGEQPEQQEIDVSYEPSNEVIVFQKNGIQNQQMQILTSSQHIIDQVSHSYVFLTKALVPTISVTLNQPQKKQGELNGSPQKSKYVELLLAEKSHSSDVEKYKIIKGGIRGLVRQKIKNQNTIKFQKNRFNYLSNPQKLPRLILIVYQQNENKRVYKSIMISDQFCVIQPQKMLTIQSNEHLRPYFEVILVHFLEKNTTSSNTNKINTLNKHKIMEEMGSFQNYLTKKNKKICNIVYAAYKYSHIVDLYFYNPENKPKKQQFLQLWKEVVESSRGQEPTESQKTCNHLHPNAKFVMKINSAMRNVRFVIAKQFTKYLSIIASEPQFETAGKWTKFDSITQMKQVYITCQIEIQSKISCQPIIPKPAIAQKQPQISTPQASAHVAPANPTPSAPSASNLAAIQKKSTGNQNSQHHHNNSKNQKNDDEDFNEDDVQDEDDDVQYQGESSQNYSISNRKRGRKLGQKKIPDPKKQIGYGKQPKYSTRGVIRRGKEDTQDSNDKRNNMAKKLKQKQSVNRNLPQNSSIGAPPFRVLTPLQASQYKDQQTQMEGKMIGLIPMMGGMSGVGNMAGMTGMGAMGGMGSMGNMGSMGGVGSMIVGAKKPQEAKTTPTVGMPKGVAMPVMMPSNSVGMNPQMLAAMMGGSLPPGMQVMPVGNNMQAVMMPMQIDKNQSSQGGMAGITGMPMGAISSMGGMPNMGGMNMIPMMMGGGASGSGMPQGFMVPASMLQGASLQGASLQGSAEKSKQSQNDKQKHSNEKKQEKKDVFPPQAMQAVDLSKMGMMGQLPGGMAMMPGQMAGMQMPQMMQMGMGGLGSMMGSNGAGIPQGIIMNPMMQMQKPSTQSKDESNANKQNPLFGGGMPFMVAQMPSTMQNTDSSNQGQNGMQMGMMGQFPMMSMPQMAQMQGRPTSQSGMPMGVTMVVNQDMNPAQLQQIQQQMQMMMMSKGMMPAGIMQVTKNDQNDPSKK